MMNCTNCGQQVMLDAYFCQSCGGFTRAKGKGKKGGLFRRWFALFIDPFIMWILWLLGAAVLTTISVGLGVVGALLFPVAYFIWYLVLFRKGQTPGKKVLGLQVVNKDTGGIPGFGKMLVRETFGKFLSGLVFGIGYIAALSDKNNQAWHDRLAGTVVIKRAKHRQQQKARPSMQPHRQHQQQQHQQQLEAQKSRALPAQDVAGEEKQLPPASTEFVDAEVVNATPRPPAKQPAQPSPKRDGRAAQKSDRGEQSKPAEYTPEDYASAESTPADDAPPVGDEWLGDAYWERHPVN